MLFDIASVDYETDRNIQDTIASEFADRTILCIARKLIIVCIYSHYDYYFSDRLRTIISYDRICVLDAGKIIEFDTPANLYCQSDSIFRSMCVQSSIALEDIRHASKDRQFLAEMN